MVNYDLIWKEIHISKLNLKDLKVLSVPIWNYFPETIIHIL